MIAKPDKNVARKKRHTRIRRNITGTEQKPRLNVFRSNNHIYAQLINDENGKTVTSASTKDKTLTFESTGTIQAAAEVGKTIAERAQDQGYKSVVFDRGGYMYHGRVKGLAEAAREAGLEF